jgi:hypothetical protein
MLTYETPAPAAAAPSPSPVGLCLRNNLASSGTLPTSGPYSQCPDIIGSTVALSQPQQTLSTPASWHQLYNVEPAPNAPNYYYTTNGVDYRISKPLKIERK